VTSTPILQALVLADRIYTDADTGKRVIAGTFNRVQCKSFPIQHAECVWAFLLLTELVGRTSLQLRFVRLSDNLVLMESKKIGIESSDPLAVLDMAIMIPPLPLPNAGVYCFECYANEALIGSVRLVVTPYARGGPDDDHGN
jgi:hypothetical protein